jgi:hypothetical protein
MRVNHYHEEELKWLNRRWRGRDGEEEGDGQTWSRQR